MPYIYIPVEPFLPTQISILTIYTYIGKMQSRLYSTFCHNAKLRSDLSETTFLLMP